MVKMVNRLRNKILIVMLGFERYVFWIWWREREGGEGISNGGKWEEICGELKNEDFVGGRMLVFSG